MPWNKKNLQKSFEKAGLALEFAKEPFARGRDAEEVFGLDIRRYQIGRPSSEYFLMWPGHETNSIVVRDANKEYGQLVLTIAEDSREFENEVASWRVKSEIKNTSGDAEAALRNLLGPVRSGYPFVKVWKPENGTLIVVNKSPSASRTFLIGKDERCLFMTQVASGVSTVLGAHAALKAPTVTFYEGRAPGRTIRQGEWFFVNVTDEENDAINTAVRKDTLALKKKVSIGAWMGRTGGKPHVADELAIPNLTETGDWQYITVSPEIVAAAVKEARDYTKAKRELLRTNRVTEKNVHEWKPMSDTLVLKVHRPQARDRRSVFVRGAVRHPDHDTVKFSRWRRVISNVVTGSGGGFSDTAVGGGTWID